MNQTGSLKYGGVHANVRQIPCAQCGAAYRRGSPNQKRCPGCQKAYVPIRQKRWIERQKRISVNGN